MKKFVVYLDDNGSVSNFGAAEDQDTEITRYDIYRACREIAMVIEQDMVVDGVIRAMVQILTPPNPEAEAKARVAEALKERNVH